MASTPAYDMALGTRGFGEAVTEEISTAVLDHFTAEGGRIIDAARNDIAAEMIIGRWLSRRRRNDMTITTTLGTPPERLSPQAIRAGVDASLARLGVDRIDVLYVPAGDTGLDETTIDALIERVAAGQVGRLGVSGNAIHMADWTRRFAEEVGSTPFTWIRYEEAPLDHVPVNHGWTTFAYVDGVPPEIHTRLREVAAELDATVEQVAFAWLRDADQPVVPIIEARRLAALNRILAARTIRLSEEQRERLDDARVLHVPLEVLR